MRARLPLAAVLPALLLAALVAAKGQAAAEELLANGDFSQSGSGWTAHGLELRFDAACDGHAAAPAAGLHLEEGGEGWFVSDAVLVEPGGTYEASGYVRFVAGTDSSSEMLFVLDFYQTVDGTGDPLHEGIAQASPLQLHRLHSL